MYHGFSSPPNTIEKKLRMLAPRYGPIRCKSCGGFLSCLVCTADARRGSIRGTNPRRGSPPTENNHEQN